LVFGGLLRLVPRRQKFKDVFMSSILLLLLHWFTGINILD
jgi:hypothetical protein